MSKPQNEYKIVSVSVASIYSKPSFSSELINQALFWEELIILDKDNNWFQVKQRDKYIGWINSFYVTDSSEYENNKSLQKKENWYFIKNRICEIILNNKEKYFLSFGTLLPCFNYKNTFISIFPNGEKVCIDKKNLIQCTKVLPLKMILKYAESLLGVPYLWGGRSVFGYDCSGLIQSLLSIVNIHFPRDTKDQIHCNHIKEIKTNNYSAGDLIYFFDNFIPVHVGMFINSESFIHSSGCVKKNSLNKKNVYYDKDLDKMKSKIFRFKKIRKGEYLG